MAKRNAKALTYDPTPYDALAAEQRTGADITQRLADLIASTPMRPSEMARRLNRAKVITRGGARWARWSVVDERERQRGRAHV